MEFGILRLSLRQSKKDGDNMKNISKGGWLFLGLVVGFILGAVIGVGVSLKNFNVPDIERRQTELTLQNSKLDSQKFDLAVKMERLQEDFEEAVRELVLWFNQDPDKIHFSVDDEGWLIRIRPGENGEGK